MTPNERQAHNFKMFKDSMNDIRESVHNNKQLKDLLYNPKSMYPTASGEIEVSHTTRSRPADHAPNLGAFVKRVNKTDKHLTGIVDIDIDAKKPFLHLLDGFKLHNLLGATHEFKKEVNQLFNGLSNHEQNDAGTRQSYELTIKTLNENMKKMQNNGDYHFQEKDEKLLLNFILGHELSHISFKDRENIQFKYMDKARLPSGEAQKYLNSAILHLNRYFGDTAEGQHEGANYKSSRDETHSDVVGMFTMAYLAYKNNSHTDKELKEVITNLGKMRHNANLTTSIHGMSTHNADIIFRPHMVDRILNLAKNQIKNPNQNAYEATLDVTEDAFFEMLQEKGVIIKQAIEVNSQVLNDVNRNQSPLSTGSVYANNRFVANEIAKEKYEHCANGFNKTAYAPLCLNYSTGGQRTALDPDGDKMPNFNKIDDAYKSAVKTGVYPNMGSTPKAIEANVIGQEAQALSDFAQSNHIPILTTNHMGVTMFELNPTGAKIKLK